MSKESKIKKKAQKAAQNMSNAATPARRKLTPEERARIIRDSLANRPVIMFRYPNGRWNLKLIITLAILVVALIVSLYFVTRK